MKFLKKLTAQLSNKSIDKTKMHHIKGGDDKRKGVSGGGSGIGSGTNSGNNI